MSDRYYFLHIPKTAGSSLHRLFQETVGPYLHLQQPHEVHWPAEAVWRRFRGCGGHTHWIKAKRNGYLDGFSLTFLRHPIDRVLSQYYFSQDAAHGDKYETVYARQFALKDLLRHCLGRLGPFWNAQTFALSGLTGNDAGPEEHLASALQNLEKFDFVGTTETFPEDCSKLLGLLGGNPAIELPHENRTLKNPGRNGLDDETLALLEESHAMDQILYNRARELRTKGKATPLLRDSVELGGWPASSKNGRNQVAQITQVEVRATDGGPMLPGKNAEIIVWWSSAKKLHNLVLGVRIEDAVGNLVAGTNTFLLTNRLFSTPAGAASGVFKFPLRMGAGRYAVDVALHRDHEDICYMRSAAFFDVATPVNPYREGMVDINAQSYLALNPTSKRLPETAAQQILLMVESKPQPGEGTDGIQLGVRLVNNSDCLLSSRPSGMIFVSYHWLSAVDSSRVNDGLRSSLPHDVWPGETVCFPVRILPPPTHGPWRLQLRLVQEAVRWHEGPGYEAAMPPDLEVLYQEDGIISCPTPTAS